MHLQSLICPACRVAKLAMPIDSNALSRYALEKRICADCGRREATEGFFWQDIARRFRMRLKTHHVKVFGFGGPRK